MGRFKNIRASIISVVLAIAGISNANATLVGVDFDGSAGASPTNWTLDSNSSNHTLTNLIDENGNATGIDLSVDVQGGLSAMFLSTIPAGQVPSHTNSLAALDGNIATDVSLLLTWSNLTPSSIYDLYVFGNDTIPENQLVTITGAGAPIVFSQNFPSNNLWVNGQVGSNALLGTFAIPVTADGAGNIQILVQNDIGQDTGIAGVAIEAAAAVPEPTTLALMGLGLAGIGYRRNRSKKAA